MCRVSSPACVFGKSVGFQPSDMGELPTSTSPAISSIDGSDDEPVDPQLDRRPTSQQSHNNEQSGTGTDPAPNPSGSPKPPTTGQKRRRVTRACDECRRKKIKCDGKQPCTHCTVYSYGQSFIWSGASPDKGSPFI